MGQVLINDPKNLAAIRDKENEITKTRIQLLLKAGANVILTAKGIDDSALKWFVDAGVIAVRRCKKSDLRHIAKACGGTLINTLGDAASGEDLVDPKDFGEADVVEESRVGDGELIYIKGCKS